MDGVLVVVGAGHAGTELAFSARQQGWRGSIVLLGEERKLPYQRPPLSKAYLLGKLDEEALALRPNSAYQTAGIECRLGVRVLALDRERHELTLSDGAVLRYGKLAWCAGGRARRLAVSGLDVKHAPSNLHYLRTMDDAKAMQQHLRAGCRLVVIGGGYVGLEVAASAHGLGADVTVIEAQPRLLSRVAGPEVSAFFESVHRQAGVTVLTGRGLSSVACENGRIVQIRCDDGTCLLADLVVAGIGMVPNVEPLQAAGLADDTGVAVDDMSRTGDSDIVAAGDCTVQMHPRYGRRLRIESVPNALEQARAAASWLCGKPKSNTAVPWFWSDQYDLKLQMVGLSQGYDRCIIRGDLSGRSFSAFYLSGARLLAVDAVNRAADFMLCKRLLVRPVVVDLARLQDPACPLKDGLEANA